MKKLARKRKFPVNFPADFVIFYAAMSALFTAFPLLPSKTKTVLFAGYFSELSYSPFFSSFLAFLFCRPVRKIIKACQPRQ